MLAEDDRLGGPLAVSGDDLDLGDSAGERQRRLYRVGEAPFYPLSQDQTVDHDLDVVRFVAGEVEFVLLAEL